jgi:flagellar biosynthesis GTPase FlhF
MSAEVKNEAPEQTQEQAKQQSDKELNFARLRKQMEEERAAREAAEKKAAEYERVIQERKQREDDDDDSSDEPYVDHKKLERKLSKFEQKSKQETKSEIQRAVSEALVEERKSQWLKSNPDFFDVMGHAQKFAEKDPELAETILSMPDTFERQKLVYRNIKALNLHQKEQPKSGVQDRIDQNRRSPYYQPSGVASAPYSAVPDDSESGRKAGYAKMQELKKNLRF